jgi:hypothetical protein
VCETESAQFIRNQLKTELILKPNELKWSDSELISDASRRKHRLLHHQSPSSRDGRTASAATASRYAKSLMETSGLFIGHACLTSP